MNLQSKFIPVIAILLLLTIVFMYLTRPSLPTIKSADLVPEAATSQPKLVRPVEVNVANRGAGMRALEMGLGPSTHYNRKTFLERVPERFLKTVERRRISNFTISPTLIVSSPNRFLFLFVIKTTCKGIIKRTNLRKTWASVTEINGQKIGRAFLVGKSNDEATQKALEEENARYGDILQTEVSDAYRGLPDKVLSGYQWFYYQKEAKADFYIFTDDDCVINMALLFDYFWTNREKFLADPSSHCGFIYNEDGAPIRGASKYAVSHETYPGNLFPPFCHGPMTIHTHQQLCDIYRQAEISDHGEFHLEDVYITGILRTILGKGTKNIKPMYYNGTKGSFSFHMGPFVWHLGFANDQDQKVIEAWKIVFNLMTVHKENETFVGYWPSAEHVNAVVSEDCLVPQINDIPNFFKNNFGTFKYITTDKES